MKILYWTLGIVFVLIIIGSVTVKIGNNIFEKNANKEIKELFSSVSSDKEKFKEEDLQGLPNPVKKWLQYSQVVGKEKIKTVRLKQRGLMRLEMDQTGMPTSAEQYFTIDEPGFIWKAKVKMAPFIFFRGLDKYYQGKGHMLIKLMSLVPVVNDKGPRMDQGTLLRYLGEMIWFPTAAVSDYIEWEEIDDNTARATMTYGDISKSAVFKFNEQGAPVEFICQRYMSSNDSIETYKAIVGSYKEFDGIKIPASGKAVWELDKGDFTYYEFAIEDVDYNKTALY